MNKEAVKISTFNLPSLPSPKKRISEGRVLYKKNFVPNRFDEMRIPPIGFYFGESVSTTMHRKNISNRVKKMIGGRINCVSVIPNRDYDYINARAAKGRLRVNMELPKLNYICKTPAQGDESATPEVLRVIDKPCAPECLKSDAMVNTD